MKPSKTHYRRFTLWQEQNGRCFYCNKQMWVRGLHPKGKMNNMATIEHILPPKLGGSRNAKKNQVCSCSECNRIRGQIPHEKFMNIRKQANWRMLAKHEQWKMIGIYDSKMKEAQSKSKIYKKSKSKIFRERILNMIRIKVKKSQAFIYI